jgi:predicted nucleotidyltransferase
MKTLLNSIIKKAIPILKKYDVKRAGIFGSYARGEQKKKSDVDFLVELKKGQGYFELIHLEEELQKKLNKEVDLLTYNSINHLLKERILKEEVSIL